MSVEEVRREAIHLAQAHREAEPNIQQIYWFPSDEEIRLVEIESNLPPSEGTQLLPFRFAASERDDLSVPSAIALINPNEYENLELPQGWGTWEDAQRLI